MKIPIEKIDFIVLNGGYTVLGGEDCKFDKQETEMGSVITCRRKRDGEFITMYIFIDEIAVITVND